MKDEYKRDSKFMSLFRSAFSTQDGSEDDYDNDSEVAAEPKKSYSFGYEDIDSSTYQGNSSSYSYAQSSQNKTSSANIDFDSQSVQPSASSSSATNIYKMSSKPKFRLSILRLEKLEDAVKVADDILSGNTITVVDLRSMQKEISRRIIDFLDGVRYTCGAKMEIVADYTYVVVPKDVELTGDLFSQIESNNV